MPPNIPGARRGVRPPRGSRKSNARARDVSHRASRGRGATRGDANGGGGGLGLGLLALVGAGVAALAAVILRQNAAYERECDRVRRRLRSKPIVTSEHAACRMECRFISPEEIRRTLVEGRVDARHGAPRARPCPKVALSLGRVRAIWADCPNDTTLVTAIDTETNHPCPPC